MTLYQGPDTIKGNMYQGKFVRVGDQVSIGPDNSYRDSHRDIAEEDGLLEALWDLRRQNPLDVDADAGLVYLRRGEIKVTHHSDTLGLPVTPEARTRSGTVFEQLSPGYKVEVEMPPAAKERR